MRTPCCLLAVLSIGLCSSIVLIARLALDVPLHRRTLKVLQALLAKEEETAQHAEAAQQEAAQRVEAAQLEVAQRVEAAQLQAKLAAHDNNGKTNET